MDNPKGISPKNPYQPDETVNDQMEIGPMAGFEGEYPGTYAHKKVFNYNNVPMALIGNDTEALAANHDRIPNETINPNNARDLNGPFVEPYGQRTVKPVGSDETRKGYHGTKNEIRY